MAAVTIPHAVLFSSDREVRCEVTQKVASAFGPQGRGFLVVTAVPGLLPLRDCLLENAAIAAVLPDKELRAFRRQHGLGTDIPSRGVPPHQRRVTTSALQVDLSSSDDTMKCEEGATSSTLRANMEASTKLICDTGIRLLEVCDDFTPNGGSLAASVRKGGTAKTRLIHYHQLPKPKTPQKSLQGEAGLWQEWHFDYGLLTGIMAPTYRYVEPGSTEEILCEGGIGDVATGLVVLDRHKGDYIAVEPIAEDCLIFQVGEAAQILSGGALGATVHCVRRPPRGAGRNPSRQTCVVFMQPHWSQVLTPPEGVEQQQVLHGATNLSSDGAGTKQSRDKSDATSVSPACLSPEDVPPLGARWRAGQMFGEFSKSTIQQYYAHKEQHSATGM